VVAFARVTHGERFDLGLEALGEFVGDGFDHDDPLGAHADLALVHEGAEGRSLDRFIEVGVFQHDQRCLAAQFEQAGLELLRGARGDDLAHGGRAGEVDALDLRRIDQRADHRAGVGRGIGDDLDHAFGEAGFGKGLDDQGMGARALFRRLEITALPQASGTAMARTPRMIGAFHGAMPRITPTGSRRAMARQPGLSDGITSPEICVVSAAASRTMLAAGPG
jgi:hypothetical protein